MMHRGLAWLYSPVVPLDHTYLVYASIDDLSFPLAILFHPAEPGAEGTTYYILGTVMF